MSLDSRINGNITILLDEPTSVLGAQGDGTAVRDHRATSRQRASIVFISHRLEEVLEISDRIYVMRDGKVVKELASEGGDRQGPASAHGRPPAASRILPRGAPGRAGGRSRLSNASGLGKAGAFTNVTFTLHEGEMLGIAGVIGSGREDLARCLAGHTPADSGTLKVDGTTAQVRHPCTDATAQGIGLVPSERKIEGLVAQFSVAENMTLAALPKFVSRRHHPLRRRRTRWRRSGSTGSRSRRRPRNTMAGSLSGGNQQKVVLAKWRIAGVKVLILDHPTRGIDVGAKEDVYELIRDMTAEGLARHPARRHARGSHRPFQPHPRHARRRDYRDVSMHRPAANRRRSNSCDIWCDP